MVDWRTLRKVDAHIHILPDAVHEANPNSDDVWVYADLDKYRQTMDTFNSYFDILNQMDFTQTEAEMIAHGNIEKVLSI